MSSIRIWTAESDYDEKAVKELVRKLANHLKVDISILTAGHTAYNRVAKTSDQFEKAVEIYLNEKGCRCLIFVIDTDSYISLQQKRQHRNSIITKIENIVRSRKFSGRVYLAQAIQELEAWLLIDCIGVCCYFARTRYSNNCREKIIQNDKLRRLINKYQVGDTSVIVESLPGGKGAKEHLEKFSEEILKALTSDSKSRHTTKHKTIDQNKYDETLSPKVAEYIEINAETLRRNNSLQHLCHLLTKCCS